MSKNKAPHLLVAAGSFRLPFLIGAICFGGMARANPPDESLKCFDIAPSQIQKAFKKQASFDAIQSDNAMDGEALSTARALAADPAAVAQTKKWMNDQSKTYANFERKLTVTAAHEATQPKLGDMGTSEINQMLALKAAVEEPVYSERNRAMIQIANQDIPALSAKFKAALKSAFGATSYYWRGLASTKEDVKLSDAGNPYYSIALDPVIGSHARYAYLSVSQDGANTAPYLDVKICDVALDIDNAYMGQDKCSEVNVTTQTLIRKSKDHSRNGIEDFRAYIKSQVAGGKQDLLNRYPQLSNCVYGGPRASAAAKVESPIETNYSAGRGETSLYGGAEAHPEDL